MMFSECVMKRKIRKFTAAGQNETIPDICPGLHFRLEKPALQPAPNSECAIELSHVCACRVKLVKTIETR